MGERWDYRSVEGLLYRLGEPADARPSQANPRPERQRSQPASQPPLARRFEDRLDIGIAVQRSLDRDEVSDLTEHYILGARKHGYRRRANIIKKLVVALNRDE